MQRMTAEASKALVEAASAAFPGLGEGAATLEIEVPAQASTAVGRIVVQGLALELGRHASGGLALGTAFAAMPLGRGRSARLLPALALGGRARLWRITRGGLTSSGATGQRQEVEGDRMVLSDILQGRVEWQRSIRVGLEARQDLGEADPCSTIGAKHLLQGWSLEVRGRRHLTLVQEKPVPRLHVLVSAQPHEIAGMRSQARARRVKAWLRVKRSVMMHLSLRSASRMVRCC